MPVITPPENVPAAERDADDFSLRCMIESMIRDGAGEDEIGRAVRAARCADASPTQVRAARRPLRRMLRLAA